VLHVVLRCALAGVLALAAVAKLARPTASRTALGELLGSPGASPWPLPALAGLAAVELALSAAVAAGLDAAALAAAALMAASAAVLVRALRSGRAGTPCGCFGARSRVGRPALARALALGAGFAVLPVVPRGDLSTDAWLALGLGLALVAVAVLAVCVLALAREVGMLRLALGPQSALEVSGEGPELGSDSGLAGSLDPRPGAPLALAVFTSEGCSLCRALEPAVASLARDPHVSVVELDEVEDREHWERLRIPGSPYAVALDRAGTVLAKGTFNTLGQLESVLATAERRMREAVHG
jgi:hypothetical protein